MQGVVRRPSLADPARVIVDEFLVRYREHDVDGMAELCSIGADLDYIPVEISRKQGALRAQGKVRGIGKVIWTGLIASFPDLSLTVHTITANDDGDVVAEVSLEGTQDRAWGLARSSGRHFSERHLFIFHVSEAELIDSITAYWNDASMSQQLGHEEVD
jgi:ketosteroid isomerase-like protein